MKTKNKIEPTWIQRNRERSKLRYRRMRDENCQLLLADTLLKSLSDKFGLGIFIPAEKFFEIGFPFGLSIDKKAKYSEMDIVVGKYCYSVFTNNTIKIHLS